MVRAHAPASGRAAGPITAYERTHILRREPPEKTRRYRELAEKLDRGTITPEELQELELLVQESEELSLENARALLRHRDPQAYEAALAEERRILRTARGGERKRRPQARP